MLTTLPLQDVELLYVPVIAVFFCRNISTPVCVCFCVCVCVCAWVLLMSELKVVLREKFALVYEYRMAKRKELLPSYCTVISLQCVVR